MGLGKSSDTDGSVFLLGLLSCMELFSYSMLRNQSTINQYLHNFSLIFSFKSKKHIQQNISHKLFKRKIKLMFP